MGTFSLVFGHAYMTHAEVYRVSSPAEVYRASSTSNLLAHFQLVIGPLGTTRLKGENAPGQLGQVV